MYFKLCFWNFKCLLKCELYLVYDYRFFCFYWNINNIYYFTVFKIYECKIIYVYVIELNL